METKEIIGYKWVEGYKAFLEKDGKLYGASQQRFEYQTENIMDEKDIQQCCSGFHFGQTLDEIIHYSAFHPTAEPYKYYHVKGLVSENQKDEASLLFRRYIDPHKTVTHHLIILDEVSEDELLDCVRQGIGRRYTILSSVPDEMFEECFYKIRSAHTKKELNDIHVELKKMLRDMRKQQLVEAGYSAPFADFLTKYKDSKYYFDKAIALAAEIDDPAMRVMALMTEPDADE